MSNPGRLLTLAASAAAGAFLTRRAITSRLDQISRTIRAFGEGDLAARVPARGPRELARLGADFNAMADRIGERIGQLEELDRLKSEFVSNASHELRTPLTTIKALTRLLLRGGLDEARQREYLETIAVECDRQIDLVLNLLDLSHIEGGVLKMSFERVDVADLLRSSLKSQSRAAEFRRHRLSLMIEDGAGDGARDGVRDGSGDGRLLARADERALRRVISNLVDNAIKYTPDGGQITLSARRSDDEVEISVTDNGRGIPPQELPSLFDKFHRGRPAPLSADSPLAAALPELEKLPGVGLGLYLAHNMIEQMGGRISVASEVGRGSTFTLYLPAWTEGVAEEGLDVQTIVGS